MLTGLSIRDFVLIERLELSPATGLTVLTGETGAGKSILLDALGAACGARSESGLVRTGAEKAVISATFSLPSRHPTRATLEEAGVDTQDIDDSGSLIVRRVINADGKSKAFVNDQPVSIALLRELGTTLVEVHGQFDTHGLLDPTTHRPALDRFGGITTRETARTFSLWKEAEQRETAARKSILNAQEEEARLRDALDELTKLAPQEQEELALLAQRQFLQGHERLASATTEALNALSGTASGFSRSNASGGAESALMDAARALAKITDNEHINRALAHIDAARDAVADAQGELESLQNALDNPESTLEQVEDRLYALRAAARKHGVTPDDLPRLALTLAEQLAQIEQSETNLHALAEATVKAKAAYDAAASDLSTKRQQAAKKLEKSIQAELAPLKMERARFRVSLSPAPPSPLGVDNVVFEATTNPGMPVGAINRIASGGELARFMLALKVVLAGVSDAVTLIFDEVDQGVGGAVAAAVGDRLAKLGKSVQVLVVTHSPQVAAKANQHWKVSKSVGKDNSTRTAVLPLSDTDRREEIARMLAGETITDASRFAAEELLG